MKATELRLGNLINFGGHTIDTYQIYEPIIVDTYMIKDILQENEERPNAVLSVYQPIPLTEEWLLKFGFKKANKAKDMYPESLIMDDVMMSRLYFRPSYRGGYYWGFITKGRMDKKDVDHEFYDIEPMLYVHQLQNFYFALTGQELTINNK